jgi:hypothetical protein
MTQYQGEAFSGPSGYWTFLSDYGVWGDALAKRPPDLPGPGQDFDPFQLVDAYGVLGTVNADQENPLSGAGVAGFSGGQYPFALGLEGTVGVFGRSQGDQGWGVLAVGGDRSHPGPEDPHGGQNGGVRGDSRGGIGVLGSSGSATGVSGSSRSGTGVFAQSDRNTALWARCQGPDRWAGFFEGFVEVVGDVTVHNNVQVDGDVTVSGIKQFKIDHPLDPENKYLTHFSVEAPEAKNVYDGLSILDEDGEAVVELPEWFEALNTDFRYQLTPIGAPAPNLHVAQKITNNSFKIAGGAPEMEVSWQVTGVRKDVLARADQVPVEGEKPAE